MSRGRQSMGSISRQGQGGMEMGGEGKGKGKGEGISGPAAL